MAIKWQYTKDGVFELIWGEVCVLRAHGQAASTDGRRIDTRTARMAGEEETPQGGLRLTFRDENGLCLEERLEILSGRVPVASCVLSDGTGNEVETRRLTPLVVREPEKDQPQVWKGIWSKMLLVPYDNTMWLRYEAASLRAGRTSYDMTVMFKEDTREGILIGALDFDRWKNGIICSATDAKSFHVCSGIADEGTHDSLPHGALGGKEVGSSRFCILYGEDYRELLEDYGDIVRKEQDILIW